VRALRPVALVAVALYVAGVGSFAVGLGMRGVLEYDSSGCVDVDQGSAAHRGGMMSGDRVVAIGAAPVGGFDEIRPALRAAPAGAVDVRVERAGVVYDVRIARDAPRGRLCIRMPVVRREVGTGALLVRSAMEPAASWRRVYLRGPDLAVAPDDDGPVSYAEFLRPKEAGDAVVSAGVLFSYALLVPCVAVIAAGLGAITGSRRRLRRT